MAHEAPASLRDARRSRAPGTSAAFEPNSFGIEPSIRLTSRPSLAAAIHVYAHTIPICFGWIIELQGIYGPPAMRFPHNQVWIYTQLLADPNPLISIREDDGISDPLMPMLDDGIS